MKWHPFHKQALSRWTQVIGSWYLPNYSTFFWTSKVACCTQGKRDCSFWTLPLVLLISMSGGITCKCGIGCSLRESLQGICWGLNFKNWSHSSQYIKVDICKGLLIKRKLRKFHKPCMIILKLEVISSNILQAFIHLLCHTIMFIQINGMCKLLDPVLTMLHYHCSYVWQWMATMQSYPVLVYVFHLKN